VKVLSFAENVFVNCPFDDDYQRMLQPMLFTIISVGLRPRIALESFDSGKPRIEKILALIRESRFGIHDLSRIQALEPSQLPRLNMPLELGLDFGCRYFGTGLSREKRCLILESQRYRYQAAMSDLSGSDIEAHDNEPRELVSIVRSWLRSEARVNAAGPDDIWDDFVEFRFGNRARLRANGFSARNLKRLSVGELIEHMTEWVQAR
jgi:hypothetical protein